VALLNFHCELRPTFVAMVTKFRQHTKNFNNVASIATDATQNYSYGKGFMSIYLLDKLLLCKIAIAAVAM